jgi:excisionase family DNA binding protein
MGERATERSPESGPDAAAAALTARAAAARLGIAERTVRRAIARGELAATKRAGAFQIDPAELVRFRTRRARPGRQSGAPLPAEPPSPASPVLIPLPDRALGTLALSP